MRLVGTIEKLMINLNNDHVPNLQATCIASRKQTPTRLRGYFSEVAIKPLENTQFWQQPDKIKTRHAYISTHFSRKFSKHSSSQQSDDNDASPKSTPKLDQDSSEDLTCESDQDSDVIIIFFPQKGNINKKVSMTEVAWEKKMAQVLQNKATKRCGFLHNVFYDLPLLTQPSE